MTPSLPIHLFVCILSCVQLFETPWTRVCGSLLSMGFSRQEYWTGLPFPLQGDLPNLGVKPAPPVSPTLHAGLYC